MMMGPLQSHHTPFHRHQCTRNDRTALMIVFSHFKCHLLDLFKRETHHVVNIFLSLLFFSSLRLCQSSTAPWTVCVYTSKRIYSSICSIRANEAKMTRWAAIHLHSKTSRCRYRVFPQCYKFKLSTKYLCYTVFFCPSLSLNANVSIKLIFKLKN